MELPLTIQLNKYVVVFFDYLTKFVKAYPASDQASETNAQLLVNNIICCQLISDRGANLLSAIVTYVKSMA